MKSPIIRLLSRRNLLRNAGLMALLSPLLRQLEARAQAPLSPRRVILLFSPNGPMKATGPASGTETDFTLHDWWKPLERHKAEGIFMSHMACTGAGEVKAVGHALGGQTYSGYDAGANGDSYLLNGETIDQVIGKRLEQEGRGGLVRSLVWGNSSISQTGGSGGDAFASGPGRTITPETSPSEAWRQLFATSAGANAAPMGGEKSMLDFVVADCQSLQTALGSQGRALLEDHCTTLRTLEKNVIAPIITGGPACARPAPLASRDWENPENWEAQSAAFHNLIAATLACELSHVVAFQFACQAARNRLPVAYGVPSSATVDSGDSGPAHHPWSHQDDSQQKLDALRIFTTAYSTQVAALLDKLKATKDALGKPLMESTVVLWLSELGGTEKNQDPHITRSVPAMLFGNGQGVFKTGRYIRGPSEMSRSQAGAQSAQLLVSLIQYMGLTDINTVGVTKVSGPLPSLYV